MTTLKTLSYRDSWRLLTKNDFTAAFNSNNLSSLTHIDFHGCINFDDEGLVSLAQVCQDLRELDVGNCKNITDKEMLFIMSKCKQLHTLKRLNFKTFLDVGYCKNITDDGILFMMSKCKQLNTLRCW